MGSPGIRPIRLYRFTEDNVSTSLWNARVSNFIYIYIYIYIYITEEDIEEIILFDNYYSDNFEYEEKNRITSYEESEKKREGRDSLYRSRSSE